MRPSRIIPLCLLALGLMALAAHGAPDAGWDASMSLPVAAPVVAPLQVVTAPAPDPFLDANSWPLAVLVVMVILTGVIRRVVPATSWPWLHTGQGLWVTSGVASIATAAAQAVAVHGFKPSVLVMAVAQWATSAASMAHSQPSIAGLEPLPLPPAGITDRQYIDKRESGR